MVNLHSYDDDISFQGFDEYVRKTLPSVVATISSFDELIKHISRGITRENLNKDLFLARGFLVCLSLIKADNESFFSLDDRVWNWEDPAELFDAFCSYAGIECHVVQGVMKGVNYQVGDLTIEGGQHRWSTFRASGKWHLFDPHWCVSCVINYSPGNEILIENDGEKSMEQTKYYAGLSIACFDDDWFCTSKEVFNIHHFPDDPQWQLCEYPLSLEEWLDLPMRYTDFYKYQLHLLSVNSATLYTKKGKCMIHIMAEGNQAKRLIHANRLYMSANDPSNISAEDWPLLVLAGRDKNIFIFEIRFPIAGKYRFEIHFGNVNEKRRSQCCEFCIICDEADPNCKKLPIDTGIHGYGFGSLAEEGGLSKPSVSGPKLFTNPENEKKRLAFKVEKDAVEELEYGSFIFTDSKQISANLQVNKPRRLLEVNADIATDDTEYALMVGKRPKNSNADFEPLLYYLVSTEEDSDYREMSEMAKTIRLSVLIEQKREEKQQRNTRLLDRRRELEDAIQNLQSDEVRDE